MTRTIFLYYYIIFSFVILLISCTTNSSKVILPKERGVKYIFKGTTLYYEFKRENDKFKNDKYALAYCTRQQAIDYLRNEEFNIRQSFKDETGERPLYATKIAKIDGKGKMYNIYIYNNYWYETTWGYDETQPGGMTFVTPQSQEI